MTSVLIIAGLALVLAAGWALLRAAEIPITRAAPKAGNHVLLDHSPVGALLFDPVLREVAALAAGAWKSERWELWLLGEDRTLWTLDQVRVWVTSDVNSDPDAHVLLGQGSIGPDVASRMDIPI